MVNDPALDRAIDATLAVAIDSTIPEARRRASLEALVQAALVAGRAEQAANDVGQLHEALRRRGARP